MIDAALNTKTVFNNLPSAEGKKKVHLGRII